MQDYIDKQTGLLNSNFFNPISNSEMNKNWYVVTNNTSWPDVEKAIHSGPYTTMNEAYASCLDTSMWPELLTVEEAEAITY